ncbi:MAG TPA: plastocyanin/azurin family copper-binding protein, partial [Nitrososphaeraceae archaeon]|nr:plastocyanin/azurin family copper-binding protein [Nitrososphaeraceae archaeon]
QEGAITSQGTVNNTMGNDTSMMMNATLAYAQEGAITSQGTVNNTMGNDTSMMMNATLAYAQEAVSISPGSSNPSATQFFVPPEITVSSGTTVTWTNHDTTIHTVVEGTPGAGATPAFDSSIIAPTATWENTFDKAGEFNYYCSLHPFMTGEVKVT